MKSAIDSKTPTARGLIVGASFAFLLTIAPIALAGFAGAQSPEAATSPSPAPQVYYRSTTIDDVEISSRGTSKISSSTSWRPVTLLSRKTAI